MKYETMLLVLVGLVTFSATSWADPPDPNFYVFVCFGQSNMEGAAPAEDQDKDVDTRFRMLAAVDFPKQERKQGEWYPATPPICRGSTGLCPVDYFGRTLAAKLPPEIKVGVVSVAIGGCKIELFGKSTYEEYSKTAPTWMTGIIKQYGGNPYSHLVVMARLAQKEGVIKGILLHQGESNTGDQAWPSKVKGVYEDLLADLELKAEQVPLLAGEVVHTDQQGKCGSMNVIIDELPKTIPTAHVISSSGCTCKSDQIHFDAAGYRELGRRYAEAMLPLLGN